MGKSWKGGRDGAHRIRARRWLKTSRESLDWEVVEEAFAGVDDILFFGRGC
jgi:hypothetical protein